MKNKTYLIIFLIIIVILSAWIYLKWWDNYIETRPILFGYETYSSSFPNAVLAITDLKDSTELRLYYQNLKNGKNATFNFPLQTLPTGKPLYVLSYENDSSLVEIYCYSKYLQGGYYTGYILTELTHLTPPR